MAQKLNKEAVYKSAKPAEKDYFINDGGGLYMWVKTNGSKLWQFVFTFDSKRKRLPLGPYPKISLALARQQADIARNQVANDLNPVEIRKQSKADKQVKQQNQIRQDKGLPIINSFTDIAMKWFKSKQRTIEDATYNKKLRRFELHVFPVIGHIAIDEVKSPDVFNIVKPLIEQMKLDTAHRTRAEISEIFDYAIVHGLIEYDPAQAVAKQIPSHKAKHRPALTEPKDVAQLLKDIYSYEGTFIVQQALRLSPLLFQRPGEIRTMLWQDLDFNSKEWRYEVSKTKVQHIVPLSDQAIEILTTVQQVTGDNHFVFPSVRNNGRPMSDGTIGKALKTMGYSSESMCPHGFRTTASTLLNEQGWSPDAIERQLSHMPKDQVRAAYNRAQYLDERRKLMQSWADYLDGLKAGAQVIPFRRNAG
jgi:integrase